MNCTLKIIAGPENGKEFTCPPGETYLGRSQRCAVQLTSPSVSYEHAVVTRAGDDYYIENLSASGTYVNGERIAAKTRLRTKDQIRLGADTAVRVTALPATSSGNPMRRALIVLVATLSVVGVAVLVLDPFSGDSGVSWGQWQHAYATLQQFTLEQVAARKLPVETETVLSEAWRLESANDRAGAGAQWVRLHLLLSGRGDPSGVEAAADNDRKALGRLLRQSKNASALSEDELKAALLEFVVQMERRK